MDRTPDPPGRPVHPPRLPPPGYPDCCEGHRRVYEQIETGRGAANANAMADPVADALALVPPVPTIAQQVRRMLTRGPHA